MSTEEDTQRIGVGQAADVLQITEQVLLDKLEAGEVPGTKIDGRWGCDLRELVEYIHAQKAALPPPGATVVITREQIAGHRKAVDEAMQEIQAGAASEKKDV
jgi:hypothetical protein